MQGFNTMCLPATSAFNIPAENERKIRKQKPVLLCFLVQAGVLQNLHKAWSQARKMNREKEDWHSCRALSLLFEILERNSLISRTLINPSVTVAASNIVQKTFILSEIFITGKSWKIPNHANFPNHSNSEGQIQVQKCKITNHKEISVKNVSADRLHPPICRGRVQTRTQHRRVRRPPTQCMVCWKGRTNDQSGNHF